MARPILAIAFALLLAPPASALTNTDDASWRAYYVAQLRKQVATTRADGAFLDSTGVPNAFGPDTFTPKPIDVPWELGWTKRIERWLPYVQRKLGKPVVVNAGSLVTTRDRTSYAGAAGVMIDGFATGLAPADWELDLGRGVDPPGLRRDQGAFVRHFERGLVVVNPSVATVSYTLSGRMYRYVPGPGGTVPGSGKTSFHRNMTVVSSVTLGPRQAAVLLH